MRIGIVYSRRTCMALVIIALARLPVVPAFAEEPDQSKAEQHFDVTEYRVIGNSVLGNRDIERVLYPLLGPNKTLTDVEGARSALETYYHDHGYGTVFVDIPPQKVEGGLVRLRVTEGRVEKEQISGAHYFPERDVIAALPAAAPGQVLQLSKLQDELQAVNAATPDRSVVPVLKAGSAPGTVDLALQVHDTLPLHGSLEFNNQASLDTRPLRAIASMSYGDMFGRLDSLSLQYQSTPQQFDQVRVFAANYVFHPLDSGLQPSLRVHQLEQQRGRRRDPGRARHRRDHRAAPCVPLRLRCGSEPVGDLRSGLQALSQHHHPERDHERRYADQLLESLLCLCRTVALRLANHHLQSDRKLAGPAIS